MSKRSPTDIHNLPKIKGLRRSHRLHLTPAEAKFWSMIKNASLDGRKFRRQHSVDNFILDFYCPSERLAIELDGEGHFSGKSLLTDRSRRKHIESLGIRVIRFENSLIFDHPEGVLETI